MAIMHIIEIAIIIAHVLIIAYEWPKVRASWSRLTSKTKSVTNSSLNRLGRNFIFIDLFLLMVLSFGIFFAGNQGNYVFGSIFSALILFIGVLFVPEDYINYTNLEVIVKP